MWTSFPPNMLDAAKPNGISILRAWGRFWLVANLCALWPILWLGLGWVPDQLKVVAHPDVKVAFVTASGETQLGEPYVKTGEAKTVRFFLPRGTRWRDVLLHLDGARDHAAIETVWLQKWLFKFGRDGGELEPCPDDGNGWRFRVEKLGRVAFASPSVAWVIALLEILMGAISCVFALRGGLLRPLRPPHAPKILAVVFSCALLTEVILPIQAHLANHSAFSYPLGDAFWELLGRFFMAMFLGALALRCLESCFGRWVSAVVMAFAVCVYLESGVLSIGLPALKGEWWFFENGTRVLWDWLVWGIVFSLFCLFRRGFDRHWVPVVGAFLALVCSSLLDVRREKPPDTQKLFIHDYSSIPVVLQSVEYARNTNVLVFVIDSLEIGQAHQAMALPGMGRRLRDQFAGFTEYTNNFGACDCTLMGIANLLTGEYPEKLEGIEDYYESIYSAKSVLKDYLENGFDVYVTGSSGDRGYTNRRKTSGEDGKRGRVLAQTAVSGQPWTLLDISRFRWLPFGFKSKYLRLASRGLSGQSHCDREWVAYPLLGGAPVSPRSHGCFLFVHTTGVHIPVEYNRFGERLPKENNSDVGCSEMGAFLLGKLGELFDLYREKGVYDNALIVVLADHGSHGLSSGKSEEGVGGPPKNAFPFLWIKPMGEKRLFQTSGLPTSHAKIAGLLREACRRPLPRDEVEALLASQSPRLYRSVDLLARQKSDWWMDCPGHAVAETGSFGGGGAAELCPFESGKTYPLNIGALATGHLGIRFHSLGGRTLPSWAAATTNMACAFKVGDAFRKYDLEMTLMCRSLGAPANDSHAHMWFRGSNGGKAWSKAEQGVRVSIRLRDLIPDSGGWIEIEGKRDKGFRSTVYMEEITIKGKQETP